MCYLIAISLAARLLHKKPCVGNMFDTHVEKATKLVSAWRAATYLFIPATVLKKCNHLDENYQYQLNKNV